MFGIEDRDLAAAIGGEIAYWRKRHGMDRPELGKAIGKSKNTIGRYERGNTMPTISETWKICDALDVSVSEFVSRVDAVVRRRGTVVEKDVFGRMYVTLPTGERVLVMDDLPMPQHERLTEAEEAEFDARVLAMREEALAKRNGGDDFTVLEDDDADVNLPRGSTGTEPT